MSESIAPQDCSEDDFCHCPFKEANEMLSVLKEQQVQLNQVQEHISGILQKNENMVNTLQSVLKDKESFTNKENKNEVHTTIKNLINMLKPESGPELVNSIACVLKEFDEDDSAFCADIIFKKSLNDHWFLHKAVGVKLCVNSSEQKSSEVRKKLINLLQNHFDNIFNQQTTCSTAVTDNKKVARTVVTLVGQLFNHNICTIGVLHRLLYDLLKDKSHLRIQCIFDILIVISTGPRNKFFKVTEQIKKNLESLQKDSQLQDDAKLLVTHSLLLVNKMQ
ncbi:unnamed protein product [Diabrotica balteata]|uniref:Uncharacterized protein n=1 Tax=Diabrotica balteata TaxID=107213 RepID=A0A9N9SXF4_DIABA|nr:unnamed protein product [Diabrotica balteata]